MGMRTPLSRVLHFGSAHAGTHDFWRIRLTGAANVLLVIAFVIVLIATVGKPYGETVAILGSPFVAALFVLLIATTAIHMRIGMQEIIEDYVHTEGLKILCRVGNTFFAVAVAVVAIVAILKLAVGA